jgi:hypothetical protein
MCCNILYLSWGTLHNGIIASGSKTEPVWAKLSMQKLNLEGLNFRGCLQKQFLDYSS